MKVSEAINHVTAEARKAEVVPYSECWWMTRGGVCKACLGGAFAHKVIEREYALAIDECREIIIEIPELHRYPFGDLKLIEWVEGGEELRKGNIITFSEIVSEVEEIPPHAFDAVRGIKRSIGPSYFDNHAAFIELLKSLDAAADALAKLNL